MNGYSGSALPWESRPIGSSNVSTTFPSKIRAEPFASTDMQRQVQMLKKSLFQLVTFYVLDAPSTEFNRLAEIHKVVGVSPGMFDTWMRALLNTVEALDPEFDEVRNLPGAGHWPQA